MTSPAQIQLRIVGASMPSDPIQSRDPARQVFEHWAFMLGRSLRRCKLGPTRSAVINAALTLYDVDQLMLAIEGMAADPLADCATDKMRDAMREVEWLLARESRIERWAEAGDALRGAVLEAERQAARQAAIPVSDDIPAPEIDPAVVQAQRQHLRDLAAARRAGRG